MKKVLEKWIKFQNLDKIPISLGSRALEKISQTRDICCLGVRWTGSFDFKEYFTNKEVSQAQAQNYWFYVIVSHMPNFHRSSPHFYHFLFFFLSSELWGMEYYPSIWQWLSYTNKTTDTPSFEPTSYLHSLKAVKGEYLHHNQEITVIFLIFNQKCGNNYNRVEIFFIEFQ